MNWKAMLETIILGAIGSLLATAIWTMCAVMVRRVCVLVPDATKRREIVGRVVLNVLDRWSRLLPKRIRDEDMGDYVHAINHRLSCGQSRMILVRAIAAIFWTGLSSISVGIALAGNRSRSVGTKLSHTTTEDILRWWASTLPVRIANEEIGDYIKQVRDSLVTRKRTRAIVVCGYAILSTALHSISYLAKRYFRRSRG